MLYTEPHMVEFQSTLPVWGGTIRKHGGYVAGQISIHPPRVGRDTCMSVRSAQTF